MHFFKTKDLDLVSAMEMVDDVLDVLEGWGDRESREVYDATRQLIPMLVRGRAQNTGGDDTDDDDGFHGWDEAENPM